MAKTPVKKTNIVSFERSADFFLKNGLKKMRAGEYPEAINYLYRSFAREDRFETKLGIAQVLAQSGRLLTSNKFLHENFEPEKRTAGVLFGMACNYALVLEKKQVEILLSKFHISPDDNVGFSEETYDALVNLDCSIDFKTCQYVDDTDREEYVDLALSLARNIIILGEYKRASNILAHALSILPDGVEFVPDLLFAYIIDGNHSKAAELLGSYDLEKIHTDATFLCVLILLKHYISRDEDEESEAGIKMLASIETENLDLVNYITTTLVHIGKWEYAEPFAKKLAKAFPYGKKENHLLAVCAFNLGDLKKARDCYDIILRFEPHDVVAHNFKKRCSDALIIMLNGNLANEHIDRIFPEYDLDFKARSEKTAVVKAFLAMPLEKVKVKWEEDSEFFYELLYVFEHYLKLREQVECLEKLNQIDSKKTIKFFEECLMLGDLPFNVKNLAYDKLYALNTNALYRATFGNLIVEGMSNPEPYIFFPENYQKSIALCMEKLVLRKKGLCCVAAGELFDYYFSLVGFPEYDDELVKGIAAVVAHFALMRCDVDVDFGYVLNMFRVSEKRYEQAYDLLTEMELLTDFENEE